jgi:hypothetical protein
MCMYMLFRQRSENKRETGWGGGNAVAAAPEKDAGFDPETGVQFGDAARACAASP